jgi:hypothetical protein
VARRGPVEDHPWPARLTARVVAPGAAPRLHGFDLERDLACHYGFAELVLLALGGVAPTEAAGRAFEVALSWLGAITVAEAPAHAAVLARICGASSPGVIEVTALGLAEQAHARVRDHAALLTWLAGDGGGRTRPPRGFAARSAADRASVDRLRARLDEAGVHVPLLAHRPRPSREAALLATMFWCGLRRPEQLEAAWVIARLACAVAEGFAAEPLSFRDYPMRVPPIAYRPPRKRGGGR